MLELINGCDDIRVSDHANPSLNVLGLVYLLQDEILLEVEMVYSEACGC